MSIYPPRFYNGKRFRRRLLTRRLYKKYIANGSTDSGKSTFLEFLGEKALKLGVLVWDLWAAGTYENLFWCIPGKMDPKRQKDKTARRLGYPILIIRPKDITIHLNDSICTCGRKEEEHGKFALSCLQTKVRMIRCKKFVPLIMDVSDEVPLAKIVHMVLSETRKIKRVIVFNEGFYDDLNKAYQTLAKILKQYPYLIKRKIIPKDQPNCMIFRELGDLATGGMKTDRRSGQTEAKRQIQNLIRKNRHWHVHLLGDAQRNDDIAGAVADQKDCLIIKRITDDLIPERYKWISDDIKRRQQNVKDNLDFSNYDSWPMYDQLQKDQCYVIYHDKFIELKTSGLPGFMHKGEHDDWEELANVEIRSEPKGELEDSEDDGEKTNDEERTKILQLAYEIHEKEGRSYPKIATDIDDPRGLAAKWRKYGKPDSLQRAVNRAIKDGIIAPI